MIKVEGYKAFHGTLSGRLLPYRVVKPFLGIASTREIRQMQSEIERLTSLLAEQQKDMDITDAADRELHAAWEKQKKEIDRLTEKGNEANDCAWCKGDWTDNFSVIEEDFGKMLTYRHVKFCPMCGRKLKPERKEGGQQK